MIAADISWLGYDALDRMLERVSNPDPRPILPDIAKTMAEGNRRGVLQGLDKDDKPMARVTYRNGRARKGVKFRTGKSKGKTTGIFKGQGPLASGLHGNLTSTEYKALTGPPLAPRGIQSRTIANFQLAWSATREQAVVVGRWGDVVSVKGFPFLIAHFEGSPKRHLPKRDLRGIRPPEMRMIEDIVLGWAMGLMR
jgi:hypothetical protein